MKQIFLILQLFLCLLSFASVTSSFSCSSVKGCSPLVVNLTDHSSGIITSRLWDLGNGNISTQTNPSATYFAPGTYIIKLTVSDGASTDTSSQTVTVFALPVVNFTCDTTKTCTSDTLIFYPHISAGSAPISQYAWGFGNGIASSDSVAKYAYPSSGNYDVTLVVQDTNGCDGHLTQSGFLTIWPRPVAAYTVSPAISCGTSQTVAFSSQSTGSGLTYAWSFGDSTNSTSSNPSHLYSYGLYKSKMIVTNNDGCSSQLTQNISVINLKANFTSNKTTVCAGETVHFYDMSPMAGTSWYWNFGDGSTSNSQAPLKKYTVPGVYSVTFVVRDAICQDSSTIVGYMTVTAGFQVSFTADNQYSCTTPFTVNFTAIVPPGDSLIWNFGNGVSSSQANPANTYSSPAAYTVSLTAVDSTGCIVTSAIPNFINTTKPDVQFRSDTLICPGVNVGFSNYTSNAVRYLWNFGDGDTSTVSSPWHRYMGYGRFTVSLTAWDSLGCDSTMVKTGYINSDSTVVGFTVDEGFSKCPPLVSVFSSHVNRPDLKYLWDFGDGYTDTAANPTHIFFHAGLYTVTLTGTNPYGCTGTHSDSNLISVQGPSGTFSATPGSGCLPLTVSFSGTASSNTQSVQCDLGDGTLITDSLNFNYSYTSARVFYPKFILTDYVGCSVSYGIDSIVTHPIPVLNVKDTSVCAGSTVHVSLGTDNYLWKEDNVKGCDTCLKLLSFCDTCGDVLLAPLDTTQYTVTATNEFGCIATDTFSIMVDALPVLIPQDTIKICKNSSVTIDAVQQAYRVDWSPAQYLSSSTVMQPLCTPETSIDYTVTAYNELGCMASETVPVRLFDHIGLSVGRDTAVCAGSQVQLYATVTDTLFHGVSYTWEPAAGLDSRDVQNPVITAQSETETFTVIASSGTCIADTATVTVSVSPRAKVQLPSSIITTPFLELSLSPVSGDLTSYHWTAKDSLSCATCPTASIVPTESQVVYLSGTNQYGCATEDSMFIHVMNCDPASVFVPNTFTPNNDGQNDRLYVRSKTLAELDYFRVYNRWGAIVFESKSMSDGWDGTVNGRVAEQGVYVYQYSGKCENGYDVSSSGTVTLIR